MRNHCKFLNPKFQPVKPLFLILVAILLMAPFAQAQNQYLYHIDGTSRSYATSVVTYDGEIITTGYTVEYDEEDQAIAIPYICKKDQNRNVVWLKHYNFDLGQGLYPKTIIRTNGGDYLIGGNTQLDTPVGNTMFLMLVDANGNLQWFDVYFCQSLPLEGVFSCEANYLNHVTEIEGGFLISGLNRFTNDNTTMAMWLMVDYQGTSQYTTASYVPEVSENEALKTYQLSNGDYLSLIRSTSFLENNGIADRVILKKMDAQFNNIWEKEYYPEGSHIADYAVDFVLDQNENIVVLTNGFSQKNVVSKLNSYGNVIWTTIIEKPAGSSNLRPKALTTDWAGNVYCTGQINNANETVAYVIKLNTNGGEEWARIYGKNAPNGRVYDIEMIHFPAGAPVFGDYFVFVGTYNDNYVGHIGDSWITIANGWSGEAGCRYSEWDINPLQEAYRFSYLEMPRIDLETMSVSFQMEIREPEYSRVTCSPFLYFPLSESDAPNHLTNIQYTATLAPNPSTGHVEVITEAIREGQISIYSPLGQLMLQQPFSGRSSLNLQHLPKGTYIIQISDRFQDIKKKLILQ